MKEVTLFVCEICGEKYKDKNKAEQCEKSHISIKEIEKASYRIHSRYPAYPDTIKVRFSNGSTMWYKR